MVQHLPHIVHLKLRPARTAAAASSNGTCCCAGGGLLLPPELPLLLYCALSVLLARARRAGRRGELAGCSSGGAAARPCCRVRHRIAAARARCGAAVAALRPSGCIVKGESHCPSPGYINSLATSSNLYQVGIRWTSQQVNIISIMGLTFNVRLHGIN